MSYVEEIRRRAETVARVALPEVAAALWRAYGDGHVTEAEAGTLSDLIETRRREKAAPATADTPQDRMGAARSRVGSRPRSDASLGRRRRWTASGRLPPGIAARFTMGEQAVLSVVAAEVARRGRCALAHGHVAAIAGVSVSTVKRALRAARDLALIEIEVRRVSAWRNDTNRVAVVSREWLSWLRLARKGDGVQVGPGTPTQVPTPGKTRSTGTGKGCRKAADDVAAGGPARIGAAGRRP